MRSLHILLLSLAISFFAAGANAWAQRGGGFHGSGGFHGGGGWSHGGGGFRGGGGWSRGGGFHGGGGWSHGGFGGGFFGRGGYGHGGYGGWGYGHRFYHRNIFLFNFGFFPFYGYPFYPYYAYYPYYSYYPGYSPNGCYPYGPYDCYGYGNGYGYGYGNGYGDGAAYDPPDPSTSGYAYSQTSAPTVTRALDADGQWHRFGAQQASVTRQAAVRPTPRSQTVDPANTYTAAIADGRWHRFGPAAVVRVSQMAAGSQTAAPARARNAPAASAPTRRVGLRPAPVIRISSPQPAPRSRASGKVGTYSAALIH
jgi:hypothetical protein